MNEANHLTADNLYLFALQFLQEPEMRSAATHLKECAVCRAQLGEVQGELVAYALTAETQTPPSQARERLLRQVAEEKKEIPADPVEEQREPLLYPRNSRMYLMDAPEEKEPRRAAPLMAWLGWGVVACLAVVTGIQVDQRQMVQQDLDVAMAQLSQSQQQNGRAEQVLQTLRDPSAMQVAMHLPLSATAPPKLDPEAHVIYLARTGALLFMADHLDPLQSGTTYELWLLPAQAGQPAISAGLFKPDSNGNASVVMPPLPKGVAAKGFGVTVEKEGGSQTPTAPIILAGM